MAKSGYLPDLSGVFTSWRDVYKKALTSGNWKDASLALHNMNGALDEDYRLPISSEMWKNNVEGFIVWRCKNCTTTEKKTINKGDDDEYEKEIEVPTTSKRSEIRIFQRRNNTVVSFLAEEEITKMWECPKCLSSDSVKNAEQENQTYPSPHYRGCIYDEPSRPLTGLAMRRGAYPRSMEAWCRNYSIELEHQLAVYRIEYIRQNGHDMEDSGYKDDGK
jgi:hypothetical protein